MATNDFHIEQGGEYGKGVENPLVRVVMLVVGCALIVSGFVVAGSLFSFTEAGTSFISLSISLLMLMAGAASILVARGRHR